MVKSSSPRAHVRQLAQEPGDFSDDVGLLQNS